MSSAHRLARVASAAVMTIVAIMALARATALPLAYHPSPAARLRLSFSARPERIEVCRTLSAEELAQRPEHMRQRVECDGKFASYRLRIDVDGRPAGESVVRGAGLRHDRPLYVLREYDIPPGRHAVHVTFERREQTDDDAEAFAPAVAVGADTGIFAGRAQREAAEHARRAEAAIPKRLQFDTTLVFAPRRVTLLTFDAERRALRLFGAL
ncbi:MAG: hypothetical protein HY084_07540 [Gemmatimonadetes bacterium]|nr:hypothetical protein [Gemmatimonadota bacterium]